MYFASISVSIFTLSPIFNFSKFVCLAVCGISDTVNLLLSQVTTVKLIPLIVIEPWFIISPWNLPG